MNRMMSLDKVPGTEGGTFIYPFLLGALSFVHATCFMLLRGATTETLRNDMVLRMLLIFGYLIPMVYQIRTIYIGVFAPDIIKNTASVIGVIFIGMGLPFLQACLYSDIAPIVRMAPKYWLHSIVYYTMYIVPVIVAMCFMITFTAQSSWQAARDVVDSWPPQYFIAYRYVTCSNGPCTPSWPSILGYIMTALLLIWLTAVVVIFGRQLPGLFTDVQSYLLFDFIPSTNIWFKERFPVCTSVCGLCCGNDVLAEEADMDVEDAGARGDEKEEDGFDDKDAPG